MGVSSREPKRKKKQKLFFQIHQEVACFSTMLQHAQHNGFSFHIKSQVKFFLQIKEYKVKVRYSRKNIGIICIAKKNLLRSILSFVFWIFPPLDTAVQLKSADSK